MLKYHSENSPQKLWLALSFGFQKIRYYCTASVILIKSNAWNGLKGGPRRHPPPVVSVLICTPGSFLKPEVLCSESPNYWPMALVCPWTTSFCLLLSANFLIRTLAPLDNNSSFPLFVSLPDLACPQDAPAVARWLSYLALLIAHKEFSAIGHHWFSISPTIRTSTSQAHKMVEL